MSQSGIPQGIYFKAERFRQIFEEDEDVVIPADPCQISNTVYVLTVLVYDPKKLYGLCSIFSNVYMDSNDQNMLIVNFTAPVEDAAYSLAQATEDAFKGNMRIASVIKTSENSSIIVSSKKNIAFSNSAGDGCSVYRAITTVDPLLREFIEPALVENELIKIIKED